MWFYIKWRYGNFVKIKFFTAWKVYRYGVFSGPCFLVFGPWTEIYPVNTDQKNTGKYRKIQENTGKYRKMQTRKNSVFGHFPRSVCCFSILCTAGNVHLKKSTKHVLENPNTDFLLVRIPKNTNQIKLLIWTLFTQW